MKHTFCRFLSLFLCISILLSMAACTADNMEASTAGETTTDTVVTEPPVHEPYNEAVGAVTSASDLSLRATVTKTTTVAGETFVEKIRQTLRLSGLGTDNPLLSSEESVSYANDYSTTYDEVFANGMLYVTVDNTNLFCGEMSAEDCLSRYTPAVLLDASLYGSITAEESASSTTLSFADPSAAESWAIPADAELVDASGTAVLSSGGELQKSTYSVTYNYGSAQIQLEAEVTVRIEPVTVEVPADPSAYTQLASIDAARLMETAVGYLFQASTYSSYQLESMYCEAAGVLRNQSVSIDTYYNDNEFVSKSETSIYFRDYSSDETQEYDLEETCIDGVYAYSEDGGESVEVPGVSPGYVRATYESARGDNILVLDTWQDATVTDLGALYLIELTLVKDWGSEMQSYIAEYLWNDADFLMDLASEYANSTLTSYVGIDKFTGLPTSTGFCYEGTHTIEGYEYLLFWQLDQSFESPSLGAYKEVTDKMLPEEAAESAPTPLFYHVTGTEGQEMWLFGTIHVGNADTASLPQEIYDALGSSDALAIECDNDGFAEQYEEDEDLQDAISDAYYYSDGTTIQDHIDAELYEAALPYMKATGNYNMNADYMKPYCWHEGIDDFYLRQGYQLTRDQGIEERLTTFAAENDIELREVESCLFQIQMLTDFSEELQEFLLEDTISTDAQASWAGTMELFELWCSGDEAALRERISCEVDTSELTEEELTEYEEIKHLLDEYNEAVSHSRNDGMLDVLIGYLESGDTVFVAVGLAHLLDETNGLVDTLREAGYTVELVEFN